MGGHVTGERPDGTTNEDTALVILDQKDGKITGSLGGDDGDQHPISSATIEGNKLTLKATHTGNGREFLRRADRRQGRDERDGHQR